MNTFIGFCILLLAILHRQAEGTATFQLQLIDFQNPSDREADGDCCESIFSFLGCGETCDPYFKICLDISAGSETNPNACAFKSTSTNVYSDTINVVFEDTLSSSQPNPIEHTFDAWPGSVLIKIQVFDHDSNNDDNMGLMFDTFSQSRAFSDRATAESNAVTLHLSRDYGTHTISMTAKASVFCDTDFYGGACDVFCQPQNDDVIGHYTCDSVSGRKVCRENYYGPNCTVFCQGQDSNSGHYKCNQQGEIECLPGWTNVTSPCLTDVNECENEIDTGSPCSPYGNCTNLNGSYSCQCDENHTGVNCTDLILHCSRNPCDANNTAQCNNTAEGFVCSCLEAWTGQRCEIPITPCTSAPCLNGGTCSVVGDGYQCKCIGRWTGDQCQTRQTFTTSDFITIYVKGRLSDNNRPAFIQGVTDMLLNLKNVTIDTLVLTAIYLDGSRNLTQVNVTIYSKTSDVTGLLSDLFSSYDESVTNSYIPNPIYKGQVGEEEVKPLSVSEPWVKQYWYIVLIIILVLLGIITILVVVLHFLKKRRDAKLKSGLSLHSSVHSTGTVSDSLPDAAVGFDNSLYFEVNHEKVSGLPNGASNK